MDICGYNKWDSDMRRRKKRKEVYDAGKEVTQ